MNPFDPLCIFLRWVETTNQVSLFLNEPLRAFVEQDGGDSPFSGIHVKSASTAEWTMVDVDGDGDLDFVFLPKGGVDLTDTSLLDEYGLGGPSAYQYFEQLENGELAKREGAANPLLGAPRAWKMYGLDEERRDTFVLQFIYFQEHIIWLLVVENSCTD